MKLIFLSGKVTQFLKKKKPFFHFRWALLYISIHPDVQTKCQNEIDTVLGSRWPTKSDMEKLPYVMATIMEIQRCSCVAPGSLIHVATQDVKVDQYVIPKNAELISNLRLFLRDPKSFPEPEKFNPERFLDNGKIKKIEQFVPFGVGKRICMGESLAKHEIFIFFTMILQGLVITPAKGKPVPNPMNFQMPLTTMPDEYYVSCSKRLQN